MESFFEEKLTYEEFLRKIEDSIEESKRAASLRGCIMYASSLNQPEAEMFACLQNMGYTMDEIKRQLAEIKSLN